MHGYFPKAKCVSVLRMLIHVQSLKRWSREQFGAAKLDDARRTKRLITIAARAARRPDGKVTDVFTDAAERQGTYSLLENPAVAPAQLSASMFAAAAVRCAEEELVFVPVDGSSLTLTDLERTKGFGSIGSRKMRARGLKVMSALALSAQGVPIGLLSQQWWVRTGAPVKQQHQKLAASKKETQHWLAAIEQAGEQIARHARKTRLWYQLDREADNWAILDQLDAQGHTFTVRANHDRRVRSADGSMRRLREILCAQTVSSVYELAVNAAPGRVARTAVMHVRAATVTLDLRDRTTNHHFPKTLNAVVAREQDPPAGQKAIEWMLLTNAPIETTEDLAQIIYGYSLRWRIEEFHRTWKSGACNVETMQLRSVGAAIKWATILAAVAVRIERIKLLSREQPDLPATSEFSRVELKAIVLLRFEEKKPPPHSKPPTLAQATTWLAELGGYTGRTSSGGPPGSITLARGWEQVQTAVRALNALRSKKM